METPQAPTPVQAASQIIASAQRQEGNSRRHPILIANAGLHQGGKQQRFTTALWFSLSTLVLSVNIMSWQHVVECQIGPAHVRQVVNRSRGGNKPYTSDNMYVHHKGRCQWWCLIRNKEVV